MTQQAAAFTRPDPSLASLLGSAGFPASVDPSRPALRWDGGSLTYSEFKGRVLRAAAGLLDRGLKPGDRVAAVLSNRPETFELLFACAYTGLVLVPINFRFTAHELKGILEDCSPRILVTQERFAAVAGAAVEGLDIDVLILSDDPNDGGHELAGLAATDSLVGAYETRDPLLILYTSGTSGRPKGVVHTHATVLAHAETQIVYYREFSRDTVLLVNAPLYNASGIYDFAPPTFMAGGEVCLMPSGGWSAADFAARVDQWGVTLVLLFPLMLQALLDADREAEISLVSLRHALTGGDQLPAATLRAFAARWSHFRLATTYGLTEGGLLTYSEDSELLEHPESVGRAVTGLRIVDDDGHDVPDGSVGEILAGGSCRFPGYFNAPELTSRMLRADGWLATGDLGRRDRDGYVYIEGRKKDLIISGGQNIYPAEIEHVLSHHPAVHEVAVIGVPDSKWGEAVCAVIVPRDDHVLSAGEVRDHVTAHLASYKKPRYVQFVDQLPRSSLTYVLKAELRERFADLEARTTASR